ncbi:MAG: site-specific integrase [Gemmatimonadales bacterium]|nr:site-specific integrase [Gemmatimonadales bacterium]
MPDGTANPLFCLNSPRCEHHWHYVFHVNGRRYRASTETHLKNLAEQIEARAHARVLEGRHGIRRIPDITFAQFARVYLRDHAALHKKSAGRDEEILKSLERFFGPILLRDLTAHRVEQWKRERLAGRWRGHLQKGKTKPIQPATVNRELDTLKSLLSKAVEWGKLVESPARNVKRLRVENRRTRILSPDEQARLVAACSGKLRAVTLLALITGARVGELLNLRWDDVTDQELVFWNTKNDKTRRIPLTASILEVLRTLPRVPSHEYVISNTRTGQAYTVSGLRCMFNRAVRRARIVPDRDVTLHTLRHTAISRMIAEGHSDHTVMAISGHSSTPNARALHPSY